MLPDLNRLKIFYYVYLEQGNTAAAKRLHITQSGVSQHLQKLESELKTTLFTRTRRQLVPTAAGKKLFHIIQPFIEELEVGVKNIKKSETVPSGYLRMGFPVEFSKAYLPAILASFRARYPDVSFFIRMGDPETLLPLVSSGELDFAYIDIFPNSGTAFADLRPYSVEPILEEELVLACSKTYYDRRIQGDHSFERLAGLEYLAYKINASSLQSWFKFNFERLPGQLNIVLTIDSVQAVVEAIRCDLGAGVIVTHAVSDAIHDGSIVPLRISSNRIMNKIAFFQLLNKTPSLTEKLFQSHFQAEICKPELKGRFRGIQA